VDNSITTDNTNVELPAPGNREVTDIWKQNKPLSCNEVLSASRDYSRCWFWPYTQKEVRICTLTHRVTPMY
jgi:hypothetical protein